MARRNPVVGRQSLKDLLVKDDLFVFPAQLSESWLQPLSDGPEVAGHCGPEIRSDVHVLIEPRERGGIAIELESRVKPYYGDSIRRQTEEVLEALGVRHAL